MLNEFMINPSMAGLDGRTIFNITGRKEWVGFGNGIPTPFLYSASLQYRMLDRKISKKQKKAGSHYYDLHKTNVGLGVSFAGDNSGAIDRKVLSAVYAYHLEFDESQLSFGLSGMLTQLSVNTRNIYFEDNTDAVMGLVNNPVWIPDFAFGIQYKIKSFRFGASCFNILGSSARFSKSDPGIDNFEIGPNRNYCLSFAYLKPLSDKKNWRWEPSAYIKYNNWYKTRDKSMEAEMVLRTIFKESFWLGAGYRTSNDVIFLVGMKYNEYYLSYSFDYGNNGMSQNSYGSHEISISVKLGRALQHIKCKADE